MIKGIRVAFRAAAYFAVAPSLLIAGCGMNGAPLPPSLKLPQPVTDLAGQRVGFEVLLHWTMPKRDTDKVILKGDQRVRICRRLESGACQTAGELLVAPFAAAAFVDHLPPELAAGAPRLLTYTVELENRAGHTAGSSNPVYTVSGAALPPVADFAAAASPEGVVLRWKAEGDGPLTIRLHRTLLVKPGAKSPDQMAGSPTPSEQTLEVAAPDQGQALDRDAALDNTYRYTAERVRAFNLQGHAFEETSAPGASLTLDARDVFPPRTPTGLQAVADPEARAIDLSWAPNPEADIAGYIVYRSEVGANPSRVRVSPQGLVAPSFRDASALPGHSYAYSVSAIDRDGNESPRSAEAGETLPRQ